MTETIQQFANRRYREGLRLGLDAFPWEEKREVSDTENARQEAADGWLYSLWGYLRHQTHRRLWMIAMAGFAVAFTALTLIEELEQEGIDEDQFVG
jgi:hypothetical protein